MNGDQRCEQEIRYLLSRFSFNSGLHIRPVKFGGLGIRHERPGNQSNWPQALGLSSHGRITFLGTILFWGMLSMITNARLNFKERTALRKDDITKIREMSCLRKGPPPWHTVDCDMASY